jgi:hypothetical protein
MFNCPVWANPEKARRVNMGMRYVFFIVVVFEVSV